MTQVLILGANGQLARVASRYLLDHSDCQLRLFLRQAERLNNPDPSRCQIIEGDVLTPQPLQTAMQGVDIVLASLAGDLRAQASSIIESMQTVGVNRLIFITSMGIYDEVHGAIYGKILDPYRDAAAEIEASDLNYTLIRPAWFTDEAEIDYHLTKKGENFLGMNVSMQSISDLVYQLIRDPDLYVRESLGIAKYKAKL